MRKLAMILMLGLFALPAMAQSYPKAEVFGGYQYTRFDGGENANGWNAAATVNVNHWFGVTADFSGAYFSELGANFHNYTYTFGPTVSFRGAPLVTPFAHALFGGATASAGVEGVTVSQNGFAAIIGGGVDVKVSPHFAVRPVQFDWMSLHGNGATSNNNFRYLGGRCVPAVDFHRNQKGRPCGRSFLFWRPQLAHGFFYF